MNFHLCVIFLQIFLSVLSLVLLLVKLELRCLGCGPSYTLELQFGFGSEEAKADVHCLTVRRTLEVVLDFRRRSYWLLLRGGDRELLLTQPPPCFLFHDIFSAVMK